MFKRCTSYGEIAKTLKHRDYHRRVLSLIAEALLSKGAAVATHSPPCGTMITPGQFRRDAREGREVP
jgi:hypothetical protein